MIWEVLELKKRCFRNLSKLRPKFRGHFLSSECRASFDMLKYEFSAHQESYIRGIFAIYRQREGGDPERFNGKPLAAMDGTGPIGQRDRIVVVVVVVVVSAMWGAAISR